MKLTDFTSKQHLHESALKLRLNDFCVDNQAYSHFSWTPHQSHFERLGTRCDQSLSGVRYFWSILEFKSMIFNTYGKLNGLDSIPQQINQTSDKSIPGWFYWNLDISLRVRSMVFTIAEVALKKNEKTLYKILSANGRVFGPNGNRKWSKNNARDNQNVGS